MQNARIVGEIPFAFLGTTQTCCHDIASSTTLLWTLGREAPIVKAQFFILNVNVKVEISLMKITVSHLIP